MSPGEKLTQNFPSYLAVTLASILTVTQAILACFFRAPQSILFEWIGWICLWSAAIFGVVPIFTFRKKGGVPQGKSYIETTQFVDSGIYAIVRHPQNGTSWILINLGILLITRHWTSYLTGFLSIALAYLDTFNMDQHCIAKFGNTYQNYIESVPRVNFLRGICRKVTQHLKAK